MWFPFCGARVFITGHKNYITQIIDLTETTGFYRYLHSFQLFKYSRPQSNTSTPYLSLTLLAFLEAKSSIIIIIRQLFCDHMVSLDSAEVEGTGALDAAAVLGSAEVVWGPKYFKSASEERREVYVTIKRCIIFARPKTYFRNQITGAAHNIIYCLHIPCKMYAFMCKRGPDQVLST